MKVLIIGGGRIGLAVASLLASADGHEAEVADVTQEALDQAARRGFRTRHLDASRRKDCVEALAGFDIVVNAAPTRLAAAIVTAAIEAGVHYVDTAEDTAPVSELAATAGHGKVILPGCGLSPGLVANLAVELVDALEGPIDMVVRVGGLPVHPSNGFGYGLSWDVDGLIAEYTGLCEGIVEGKRVSTAPLQDYESFVLNGRPYEAFSTAGGLGSLCAALHHKVRNLSFRTIRYPGHLTLARFLFEDLGLKRRRDMLRTVLRFGVPEVVQDVVVIFISVRGFHQGVPAERSFVRKIYHEPMRSPFPVSALSHTSAAHLCTMIDLIEEGKIEAGGVARHEAVSLASVAQNRFMAPLLD
jgi:saccharopine dehydrogenase-like NADP-dependent oxidoreductase